MTDEAKALVERLRWGAWYYEDPFDGKAYASDDPLEAADLIETQAREIERLREALRSLRQDAALLLCNAEGCAANHYGHDMELLGVPGWLVTVRTNIERVNAALAGDSHE